HLYRARTRLLCLLALGDESKRATSDIDIGNFLIQDVEEISELRFVADTKPLCELERLARRHGERGGTRSFQHPRSAVTEPSDEGCRNREGCGVEIMRRRGIGKITRLARGAVGTEGFNRALRGIRSGRIGSRGREIRRQPWPGLQHSDAGDSPAADE